MRETVFIYILLPAKDVRFAKKNRDARSPKPLCLINRGMFACNTSETFLFKSWRGDLQIKVPNNEKNLHNHRLKPFFLWERTFNSLFRSGVHWIFADHSSYRIIFLEIHWERRIRRWVQESSLSGALRRRFAKPQSRTTAHWPTFLLSLSWNLAPWKIIKSYIRHVKSQLSRPHLRTIMILDCFPDGKICGVACLRRNKLTCHFGRDQRYKSERLAEDRPTLVIFSSFPRFVFLFDGTLLLI